MGDLIRVHLATMQVRSKKCYGVTDMQSIMEFQ